MTVLSWLKRRAQLSSSLLALCLALNVLLGCAASSPIPVVERAQPPTEKINRHIVSEGETLYAIAWRYSMDYAELAAYNGLKAPYTIRHGQRLRLVAPPRKPRSTAVAVVSAKPSRSTVSATSAKAEPKASSKVKQTAATTTKGQSVRWSWPAKGKLGHRFAKRGVSVHKGLDILGSTGQSIHAAAAGEVVYAGSGLPAYGKLLIVKHNAHYLSAYAHNSRLLVTEGSKVKAGQKIAEMGSSGTQRVHLHFEIRRDGEPQNPLSLLPKRSG